MLTETKNKTARYKKLVKLRRLQSYKNGSFVSRGNKLATIVKGYEDGKCTYNYLVNYALQLSNMPRG